MLGTVLDVRDREVSKAVPNPFLKQIVKLPIMLWVIHTLEQTKAGKQDGESGYNFNESGD